MYLPKQFEELRVEVMYDLIRTYPLATLVSVSSGQINANHIPLHLTPDSGFGILRGHVSRSNPLWNEISEDAECLAIFHGPNTYISPAWYPSKQETGKVVPTWNYVVVHAHGVLRVKDDADWLRAHLRELTTHNETMVNENWKITDPPEGFVDLKMKGIVGLEMEVTRMLGKWKVSQNQPLQNREGVVEGLTSGEQMFGELMAGLVKDRF